MTQPARLRVAMLLVALLATVAAAAGITVRSTYGGRAAVDEPDYLLTALSLGEDRDLSIADELAGQRWRDFHDAELPMQTAVLEGGRRVSPHDPLLPLLLAGPVTLGGLVAAKWTLALLAGVLAALTLWVGVRRLGLPLVLTAAVVTVAAATPPLAIYGQQVYPELPAALVTMAAVCALTGPLRARGLVGLGLAVVALPWLSVKYVPVAAALAAVGLWALRRRGDPGRALVLAAALASAGVAYLALHQLLYGGWTVYATADHFQQSGEFGVVGFRPNYVGRGLRLAGLLVDRGFGIAAWQPAWLLLVAAVGAVARARPRWWPAVGVPLVAGYLNAAFVALTMHGYWSPGRQLVVVLPLGVLAVAWWLTRSSAVVRVAAAVAAGAGLVTYGWLLLDGGARRLTWVSRFEGVGSPVYRMLRPLLPDYRHPGGGMWARHACWVGLLGLLGLVGWRSVRPAPGRPEEDCP